MQRKYYGITFPEVFSVPEVTKHNFARFLFFHPEISFESVESLLNDKVKLRKLSLLINEFSCSIVGISPANSNDSEEMTKIEQFFLKLYQWIIKFDFPTLKELKELGDTHLIDLEALVIFIKIIIVDDQLPTERIESFLLEYSSILPLKHVDDALDIYNLKRNEIDKEVLDLINEKK